MDYVLIMPPDTTTPVISISVPNAIGLNHQIELDGVGYEVYSVKHRILTGDGSDRSQTHEQEAVLFLKHAIQSSNDQGSTPKKRHPYFE